MTGRDVTVVLLLASVPWLAWRALAPPPTLGRAEACIAGEPPVDLNRASVVELTRLDGIGPKLARAIVAARPYGSIEELARVRGIGRKRLERLRPRLKKVLLDD